MTTLRPLLGALALTALLAARTVPDVAEELVLSAASSLVGAAAPAAGTIADAPSGTAARP